MSQVVLCRPRPAALSRGAPLLALGWAAALHTAWHARDAFTALLALGLTLVASLLLLMLQHWFVSVAALFNTSRVSRVADASMVAVYPRPHKGSAGFAPLQRDADTGLTFFDYQQRRMAWDDERGAFVKLAYPVTPLFGQLKTTKGVESAADLQQRLRRWGPNNVTLEMPSFGSLYKEHALAPFFVFQMFFVLLWCLDEYWMFALLTGFMLAAMEAFTVTRRLGIIRALRGMIQVPDDVMVLRERKWVQLNGAQLVPGDVFELGAAKRRGETLIPCDAVLLYGTCVVNEATLTGENVALLKDNIEQRAADEHYRLSTDRVHTLFGGTRLLQCSNAASAAARIHTPNGGVAVMALRTGFASSQGKVLRTIAFASETMSANSLEAFAFILFLLTFALAATWRVLQHGLLDPDKSRYKLLLECIIILTSVVPPELPIELALAVNTSLAALRALRIFCTEPFRIPFAGKLDVCAFDKTGTLTRDDLLFCGVVEATGGETLHRPDALAKAPEEALMVVAGCQALSRVDGAVLGDPLEVAALQGLGWTLRPDRSVTHEKRRLRVDVVVRFHFAAALRRMTTVALVSPATGKGVYRVCVKGAPEALRPLLRADARMQDHGGAYLAWAKLGYRVLALATKVVVVDSLEALQSTPREQLECDLEWAGFLVFECPLREGTSLVLDQLRHGGIRNIMITGDSELTAAAVAKQTGLSTLPPLIATAADEQGRFVWSDGTVLDAATTDWRALGARHCVCVTGAVLDHVAAALLHHRRRAADFFASVCVWARCSPTHKELVIVALREQGLHTLMCGDGTNDVGALKQSHVGVALVYVSPEQLREQAQRAEAAKAQRAEAAVVKRRGDKKEAAAAAAAAPESFLQRLLKVQEDADKDLQLSMGDASIAAPFTVRAPNVSPVVDVVRLGRSTLVTTLQMYFILALNGLVTAFSLSVLHLSGVRFGDLQMSVSGLFTAGAFFFITRAKPLATLAPVKPAFAIFTPYFITALLGQAAVHLGTLMTITHYAAALTPGGWVPPPSNAPFSANTVNSCVFLVSSSLAYTTFLVNYRGHPFMQSLRENSPLLKCLGVGYALVALGVCGILDAPLQLTPLPAALQGLVVALCAVDLVACAVWERLAGALFTKYSSKR